MTNYNNLTEDLLKGIGKQIKLARCRKGLSKRELTSFVGCSESLITKIENGDNLPGIINFEAIIKALDIPADSLLIDCNKKFLIYSIIDYLDWIDSSEYKNIWDFIIKIVGNENE